MVKVVGCWLVFNSWSDLKTIVHALNYLLAQESWASDLLQKQKDKTIKLVLPVVEMSLVVTDQGLFALAEQMLAMDHGHALLMLLHGRPHREALTAINEAKRLLRETLALQQVLLDITLNLEEEAK